jgi:hypothetical protein
MPPTIARTPPALVASAAPVYCAGLPVFVALAIPLPIPLPIPLATPLPIPLATPLATPLPTPLPIAMVDIDMLIMTALVALAPAAHNGTATGDRVTITSAGAAEGQPGLIMMVDVAGTEVALY